LENVPINYVTEVQTGVSCAEISYSTIIDLKVLQSN